jgi:predicted DCC family thiol-disulfide oxidoreductase YuxK
METKVLYNDTCPICKFEIDHYRKSAKGLPIRFDTISNAADWGLTADQAARRLYVMQNGVLISGIDAFRALWAVMPGYRWLALVVNWPILRPVAHFLYERVAAPILYRAHLRRSSRSK